MNQYNIIAILIARAWIDQGHIIIVPSIFLLSTIRDRDFIFGIYTPLMMLFQIHVTPVSITFIEESE